MPKSVELFWTRTMPDHDEKDDGGRSPDMMGRRAVLLGSAGAGSFLGLLPDFARAAGPDNDVGTVWWSELIADDPEKIAGFYSRVIGWQSRRVALDDPARAPKPGEQAYTLLIAGQNDVAGILKADSTTAGKDKPMWLTYFQVTDIDASAAEAKKQGGTILFGPVAVGGSARVAVIADPGGNRFGIASPL
ncbi:MAG: VOC family protein [Hyphomicrobiaceae bacterium]|nr:MAG: VOC family protein [Hyphomicrobiaceae bacterium]